MVLLDIVRRLPGVRLVVAHVNHGIREDAAEDAELVCRVAMSHNLKYEETNLYLESGASEGSARAARYNFLRHICKKYNARAVLTAHHKDDVIETAIINMLRGTGWRGLSSLRSTRDLQRPLLHVSKQELQGYAAHYHIEWRYDTTNNQTRYLRNYVRRTVLSKVSPEKKEKLYAYIVRQNKLTEAIDDEVADWFSTYTHLESATAPLPRYQLIMLPRHVAHELLQSVLRQVGGKSMTRPLADRALLFAKVAKSHKTFPIDAHWRLRALPREVIVERTPLVVS